MRRQRNRLRPLRWRLWRLPTCIPRRNYPEDPKLRSLRDNRTVEGASPATL